MSGAALGALLLLSAASDAQPEEAVMETLVSPLEPTAPWRVINDDVMGGISRSGMSRDGRAAVFFGDVSLENNGGFASVRTGLGPMDLRDWEGIAVTVEGGGQLFQLRLRTDTSWDGIAYRARFEAPAGSPRTVFIPFDEFRPTWRGRTLRDAPPLDTSRITQLGFLIADGHSGPFRLRVENIDVYRTAAPADAL